MNCINKKNPSYLKLSEKFGDITAEAAVRKITADKNLGNDFYIPSIEEVDLLIKNSTKSKENIIKPEEVLAPNGKESQLYKQILKVIPDKETAFKMWKQVYTPKFKEWFGDWETDPKNSSKVVDENGEPLLVYHGTGNKFNEFDKELRGTTTGKSTTGEFDSENAFFFTTNPNVAFNYAIMARQEELLNISQSLEVITSNFSWDKNKAQQVYNDLRKSSSKFATYIDGLKTQGLNYDQVMDKLKVLYEKYRKLEKDYGGGGALSNPRRYYNDIEEDINKLKINKNNILGKTYTPDAKYPSIRTTDNNNKFLNILEDGKIILDEEAFPKIASLKNKNITTLTSQEFDKLTDEFMRTVAEGRFRIEKGIKEGGFTPEIMPVFLNARNVNKKDFKKAPFVMQMDGTGAANEASKMTLEALKSGKDGVVFENIADPEVGTNYGIFEPNQIKSIFNEGEFSKENNNIYLQQEAQSKEKPSENIDNKIKKFLASIGVNVKLVENLTDINGNKLSGIAVADMLNKIIQIVEGKADVTTLPEEAAHFFVEMLGENNPLFKQMFDKITSYKIYSETVDQYRNNKAYKNADGSLNITKLKKEAIAKLIMTHIVRNETNNENADKIKTAQSWWSKLLEWLTNIFKQNPTNPFETAAEKILTADTSDLNLELTKDELFFQQDTNTPIGKILADQNVITLDDTVDPKTGEKKHVYQENLKPIIDKNGDARSVTNNVVTPWYKQRFPLDTRAEMKKTIDEFAAERGTDVHSDLQNIIERYFNKDGTPRETILPRSKMKTNVAVYDKLEEYIVSLIKEFESKPGTRFLPEVRIYSRKRNLPGTIDLLIMEPNGTTHIYDWKSQQIDKDQKDLKWFKPEAYRIQLNEYKKILMEEYGIFKFGKIRAVPIRTKFKIANVNGVLRPVALESIEMEYDVNNIPKDKDYLLPVVMLDESTGNNKLDSLIAKLNAVYDKVSEGSVLESEKPFKAEELNLLKKTIRDLQVRKDMSTFIENGLFEINKYRDKINNNTFGFNDTTDSVLILNVYSEGSVFLEELLKDLKKQIKEATDPDVLQYLKNLQDDYAKMSLNAKALLVDIVGIKGEKIPSGIIAKIGNELAQEEGITTLLKPEVQMDVLKRNFRSLSTLPTAAAKLFTKMLRRVQGVRNIKIKELNKDLKDIKENLEKWGKSKGLSGNDIFNPILDIDEKGRWNGDFVKIYSEEYFKLRKEALKTEDINWIKDNTDFDIVQYKIDLEKLKNNLEERYPGQDDYVVKRKQAILDDWILKHSNSNRIGYLNSKNFYIKPKEKWYSDKYKTIYKKDSSGKYVNQPLVDTYEYFQNLIKYSAKIGMINKYTSRFIPGIFESKVTNIFGTSFKNVFDIQGAFDSLAVDAEGGFGNIDPLTGVLKKQLPVYFTKDLGVEKEDGSIDYSNKSKDLFSVFSIWGQQMYNYEAMDSIKEKAEALVIIEENKSRLATNFIGIVKKDGSTIGENSVNSETIKDIINYYVYGQTKDANDTAYKINGKTYSTKKAATTLLKLSTFKTLALNTMSASATFVGGTGNAFFIASKRKLFTEKDWGNGLLDFSSNNEVTSAGIDFFDLGLDERQKQDVRGLSTDWKKRNLKWDHLMIMQHYGDKWATYPVAATMLRTFMFDGKNIISIRDYVKEQNDYENFYSLPESERKRVQKKIDKEIEELQKTKSLKAVGKVENGEFVVPGLDRKSDAAINFKAAVQKTLKSMIGNSSKDDMNRIRMGLLGQVLMQYRSWMPQLMTERFGDMTYDVDLESWQYGKSRMFLNHLIDGRILFLIKEMVTGFGNNTISKAKEKYKEFLLELMETGKISSAEEFMTESEFIDMYIGNLRSAQRELIVLSTFLLLLFSSGVFSDDDDDEDVSGLKKYIQKSLEKYKNEFSFYYSPTEFTKMLKNPIPMIGVLEDFERFLLQGIGQIYNFGIGDEEGMETNKPAKYLFKLLPVAKEGVNMYALYDDEFRKDWAIK